MTDADRRQLDELMVTIMAVRVKASHDAVAAAEAALTAAKNAARLADLDEQVHKLANQMMRG